VRVVHCTSVSSSTHDNVFVNIQKTEFLLMHLQGMYLLVLGLFIIVTGCALVLARKWKNKGKCLQYYT